MSYPINQKFNPNLQQPMGVNTPQLQSAMPETIQQNINTNPIIKSAKEDNPLFMMGIMLPIWLGISKGMDKFNAACKTVLKPNAKGELAETSLIHKVRNVGDKVGEFIGEKADGSGNANKVGRWVSNLAKKIDKNVIKKVSILNSVVHNPSKPECSFAKIAAGGTLSELIQDVPTMFTNYAKISEKDYDIKKLKALGFKSVEEFETWKTGNLVNKVDDVIARCKRMPDGEDLVDFAKTKDKSFLKNIFKKMGMSEKTYQKTVGQISRKIYFSEMANKLEALKGINSTVAKTTTGKLFAKSFLRVAEGFTNGTAGGKIAIAMQAYCFAQAIAKTIDAPKGEKLKTFMENIVYDLSFYLLMPLGINLMHHAGGLKYIGMTKTQVETYRKELTEFNKKTLAGAYSESQYKQKRQILSDMLKGDTKLAKKGSVLKTTGSALKNIFINKPIKFLGKVATVGLEAVQPFIAKDGNAVMNFIKRIPCRLQKGAGYPARVLAYFLLIAPPLAAAAVKIPHLIFGRPTKSVLDDDKKEEKPLPPLIYPSQQLTEQTTTDTQSVMKPVQQNNLAYNSMDMTNQNSQNQRTMIPTESAQQTKRRYIPSSQAVKVTMPDPGEAKARMVLMNSKKSEKVANKWVN